ncbi:MAG: radical SAM protein, partial [Sulfolobales archaeon]
MVLSESPEKLRDIVLYYYNNGVRGFLISGGFNRDGYLPIGREFIDYLKEFKRRNQVFLSVHLG